MRQRSAENYPQDVEMLAAFPNAASDERGRLRVGAALGVNDFDRATELVDVDVDVVVVDTAHGHSKNVIDTVAAIKKELSIPVVAGNVGSYDGAKALVDAGADGVNSNWTTPLLPGSPYAHFR